MDPSRLKPELIEAVCIDDFTMRKEFGRERGESGYTHCPDKGVAITCKYVTMNHIICQ